MWSIINLISRNGSENGGGYPNNHFKMSLQAESSEDRLCRSSSPKQASLACGGTGQQANGRQTLVVLGSIDYPA